MKKIVMLLLLTVFISCGSTDSPVSKIDGDTKTIENMNDKEVSEFNDSLAQAITHFATNIDAGEALAAESKNDDGKVGDVKIDVPAMDLVTITGTVFVVETEIVNTVYSTQSSSRESDIVYDAVEATVEQKSSIQKIYYVQADDSKVYVLIGEFSLITGTKAIATGYIYGNESVSGIEVSYLYVTKLEVNGVSIEISSPGSGSSGVDTAFSVDPIYPDTTYPIEPNDQNTISGYLTYVDLEGGFWAVKGDDGNAYALSFKNDVEYDLVEGAYVYAVGKVNQGADYIMWGISFFVEDMKIENNGSVNVNQINESGYLKLQEDERWYFAAAGNYIVKGLENINMVIDESKMYNIIGNVIEGSAGGDEVAIIEVVSIKVVPESNSTLDNFSVVYEVSNGFVGYKKTLKLVRGNGYEEIIDGNLYSGGVVDRPSSISMRNFIVSDDELEKLYSLMDDIKFYGLSSSYTATTIEDLNYETVTVNKNGASKTVSFYTEATNFPEVLTDVIKLIEAISIE